VEKGEVVVKQAIKLSLELIQRKTRRCIWED